MKLLAKKGFTLVELMVVIVIVGILAAVAIPKFTQASHKAKASEFPTVLSSIYSAEHSYEAENGSFVACADEAALKTNVECEVPPSRFFSYSAGSTAGTNFSALATVKVPFGDAASGDAAYMGQTGLKGGSASLKTYAKNWK
jgi:prepilin-type N-terminal cleavage/methylation domain-containing protein